MHVRVDFTAAGSERVVVAPFPIFIVHHEDGPVVRTSIGAVGKVEYWEEEISVTGNCCWWDESPCGAASDVVLHSENIVWT